VLGGEAEHVQARGGDVRVEPVGDDELAGPRLDADLGERDDAEAQLGRRGDRSARRAAELTRGADRLSAR